MSSPETMIREQFAKTSDKRAVCDKSGPETIPYDGCTS